LNYVTINHYEDTEYPAGMTLIRSYLNLSNLRTRAHHFEIIL